MVLPRAAPSDLEAGPAESGASSVIEFHSPQASQRPDHLEEVAPQLLQMKVLVDLAMRLCARARAGPQAPAERDRNFAVRWLMRIEARTQAVKA